MSPSKRRFMIGPSISTSRLGAHSASPPARRAAVRPLQLFMIGSAALHAAALILPFAGSTRPPPAAPPLQVMLEQQEPARPLPTEPPRVIAPRTPPSPLQKAPPPPLPQPRQSAKPEPVLAVPREALTAEPVVSAPAPEPRAAAESPAPAPPPRDTARTAPKAESGPPEQTSPAVFNAAYLRNPEPVYPASARRRGEQGTVMLKVLVTREGAAASVSVDKSSGSAALDQAALQTVRGWRFTPARRGSESVESSVLVPIVFRLEGAS
jgi:periplasmic protein TonB